MKESLTKQRGEELTKEGDYMLKKIGTENTFHVPEGYFESFTSGTMNRLSEKEKPAPEKKGVTMWEGAKLWVYMAAVFIGAVSIIRVASSNHAPATSDCMAADETKVEVEYIDIAVDNTILDDYSLYIYLVDPDTEWGCNNFNRLKKK